MYVCVYVCMYVCLTGFVSLSRVRSFLQAPATQASNLHDLWTEFSACLERRLLKRRIIVSLCVSASRTYAGVESINLSRTQLQQTSHHSCAYFKLIGSNRRLTLDVCPRRKTELGIRFQSCSVAYFDQVALFSNFNRLFELLGSGFAPYSSNAFYILE